MYTDDAERARDMDLLTIAETARELKVAPITIRRYIDSGRLPAVRVGRGIRVRREAVERFVTDVAPQSSREPSVQRPFTLTDPLWEVVGIGHSDEPTHIAEHKDDYLAEAYAPKRL